MDWAAILMVLIFALRGFHQGIIRQLFDLLGWIGGIWSLVVVSQWVGAHWQGARPAVVFGALGWLVSLLAALAVKALFQWWGERLGRDPEKSGGGFPDRIVGMALGAGIGLALVAALVVGMLLMAWPRDVARAAARAHVTGSLLAGGRTVLNVDDRLIPGAGALRRVLDEAARRARILRQS
ncbi:MAG: CvpA family protein [Candidatus Eisenbacteria bacterium]